MFRLVRYFSITSLLVFLMVMAFIAYRSSYISIKDMVTIRERSNVELAQVYANIVWTQYSDFIESADTMDTDEILSSPQLTELDTTLREYTAGSSVTKIKIYALNGMT